MEPGVGEVIARAVRGPARRVDFPVSFDDGPFVVKFAHALAEIADEFVEGIQLFLSGLALVEVADQTDADGDVVQIVAMDVAAVDLFAPAGADFDFTIPGGRAVADDKLIGEAVLHLADIGVIVVKSLGIALPRSAVVDDQIAPAGFLDGSAVDLFANGLWQIFPAGKPTEEGGWLEAALGVEPRFFDDQRRLLFLGGRFGCFFWRGVSRGRWGWRRFCFSGGGRGGGGAAWTGGGFGGGGEEGF